jgi:hypothetical protein
MHYSNLFYAVSDKPGLAHNPSFGLRRSDAEFFNFRHHPDYHPGSRKDREPIKVNEQ